MLTLGILLCEEPFTGYICCVVLIVAGDFFVATYGLAIGYWPAMRIAEVLPVWTDVEFFFTLDAACA